MTMTERAYLDWNATAPLRPQARAAMLEALDAIGNPSSVHAEGREARGIVEAARESVASLVGAEPRHVVFTASGTEANVLALSPQTGGHWQRLLVSAIEHPSVRSGGRFAKVASIAGFGAAASAAEADLASESTRMRGLRDRLEAGLRAGMPDVIIFGADAERLPNTTLFTVPGLKAETAVILFDLEGVAVS